MDKKTFGIGILSLTSALLLIACLLPQRSADANFVVKDRDYQLITAKGQNGDSVYVVDNRTGLMAVFVYDNRARVMRPKQVRSVSDAFLQ